LSLSKQKKEEEKEKIRKMEIKSVISAKEEVNNLARRKILKRDSLLATRDSVVEKGGYSRSRRRRQWTWKSKGKNFNKKEYQVEFRRRDQEVVSEGGMLKVSSEAGGASDVRH